MLTADTATTTVISRWRWAKPWNNTGSPVVHWLCPLDGSDRRAVPAIAELDGADLAAARAEALGHIRAYSRRQRSWFRKLGASRVDHRSAMKVIVSRLQ